MSLIVSGYHIETKPDHPRTDIKGGTNGSGPSEQKYNYKMYNGSLATKVGIKSISLVLEDSLVTRYQPKPQVLFTAMQNLRDFLKEYRFALNTSGARVGYMFSIDPIVGKSSINRVTLTAVGSLAEADLVVGRVHLAFYVEDVTTGVPQNWNSVLMFNTLTRLMELAREKQYFWKDEVLRLAAPTGGGEITQGQPLDITAPTWSGTQPDIAYWMKDGLALVPHVDGLADFNIPAVTDADVGFYQVKAGIKIDAVTTTAQWRTSEGVGVTIAPATFLLTEEGDDLMEGEGGELLIVEE
jgi:hypothetical protein